MRFEQLIRTSIRVLIIVMAMKCMAGASPILVQSTAGKGSGVNSLSVPFSSSNTAGNLIVGVLRMSTTSQTVVISDTAGNSYSIAVSQAQSADGHQLMIFYAANVVAGTNAVTAKFSAANNHPSLAVYEYAGLTRTNPLDQIGHAQGNGSIPSPGAIAASGSGLEIVGTGLPASFLGTVSSGQGYSLLPRNAGISDAAMESATLLNSGTNSPSFNLTVSTNWSAVAATFRTEAAGPSAISITTSALATATQNVSYSALLWVAGGVAPYQWSISSGTLPNGLGLRSDSGTISGTPQTPANSSFVLQVRDANSQVATKTFTISVLAPSTISHYEYVFVAQNVYVYDIDHGFQLVRQFTIPAIDPVRGVSISTATHTMYVSYGGDGGTNGNGALLAFDLLTDTVLWNIQYSDGVDSMAITPDGRTIYMPSGELNSNSAWYIIDASNGRVTGSVQGGTSPHNTVMSLDGANVYLQPRNYNYASVVNTSTNAVIRQIGPLLNGVRPSTINASQTLIFTTATGFLGFQVSDVNSGQVLYTVPVAGFQTPASWPQSAYSHGVSLSPDEKELWLMDGVNSYVHVFDITGLPASSPRQVADLSLSRPVSGDVTPCTYDCFRSGWVHHTRDGRYVVVGNSGDIFDTATRQSVTNLDTVYNTKVFLEIDWENGAPISTTTRHGLGYALKAPTTGASITQVQQASREGSSVSSLSVPFPSANHAGNLIVVAIRMSTTSQTVTVGDTQRNTYVEAVAQQQTTDGHQIHIFYARNIASGADTVSATFSGTNNHPFVAMYEFNGLSTTSPLDQVAHAQGNGTTISSGSMPITTSPNELVFAITGLPATYGGPVTAGPGYAMQLQDTGGSRAATESETAVAVSFYSGTFTLSAGANWSAAVATFKK